MLPKNENETTENKQSAPLNLEELKQSKTRAAKKESRKKHAKKGTLKLITFITLSFNEIFISHSLQRFALCTELILNRKGNSCPSTIACLVFFREI